MQAAVHKLKGFNCKLFQTFGPLLIFIQSEIIAQILWTQIRFVNPKEQLLYLSQIKGSGQIQTQSLILSELESHDIFDFLHPTNKHRCLILLELDIDLLSHNISSDNQNKYF